MRLAELFRKVREDRKNGNSQCVSAKDEYSIPDLLQKILDKEVYKSDYSQITEHVLYEKLSYNEAITGIKKAIQSGVLK